jgi:outer membrane protein OmpA-like peptidoglycan-associated protein
MHVRTVLLATVVLAAPVAAFAQPVTGIYVGAGAGANFMPNETYKGAATYGAFPGNFPFPAEPPLTSRYKDKTTSDVGGTGLASVGYGFGNGVRVEVEGDYRYNTQGYNGTKPIGPTAREQKFGGMVNALFDLDIGSPYVFPYVGAGAGVMNVDRLYDRHTSNLLAYQAIGGLSLPIPGLPGLSGTLEYRYLGVKDSTYSGLIQPGFANAAGHYKTKLLGDDNHSLMVGVRYAFNVAPPPMAAPAPAPVPQATVARSYLVFFDWDRADLTDRARQIVAEAAAASTKVQTTKIDVQGNADRTGTAAYNLALSRRRADVVKAELVRDGVPAAAIGIEAFGDTKPLVATGPGVREPQNRRVAIILH